MCTRSRTSTPDMSVQTAEAERQRAGELAFQREQLDLQRRIAEEQAAAEARRQQELLDFQRTAAEQQRLRDEALAADTRASNQRIEDAARAEREATAQAARERAARQAEYVQGRTRMIDETRAGIDAAFSGFDDSYFEDFKNSFLDFYRPKVAKEMADATRDLTLDYAATGNLNSSAAARSFGDLAKARSDAEADIASRADDAAVSLRGDVERQRSDALSSIFASGAVGDANLPDGVTDVGSALGRVGASLGDARARASAAAANVRAPSVGSLGDALSGLRDATGRVRRPSSAFARSGAFMPSSSGSFKKVA